MNALLRRIMLTVSMGIAFGACGSGEQQSLGVNLARHQSSCMIEDPNLVVLSPEDVQQDGFARAVGSLTRIKIYPELSQPRAAVPLCTGVQIDRKHVLTAAHCDGPDFIFNKLRIAVARDVEKYELATFGRSISLRYRGQLIEQSQLTEAEQAPMGPAIYSNPALDYAIFVLSAPVEGATIDINSAGTQLDSLVLYGYPHGMPLTRSGPCSGIAREGEPFFLHDCDSLPGSSGGLLVNQRTGQPVGIHLQGPGTNSSDYYLHHGHFETVEAFSSRYGCSRETHPAEEDYWQCVATRGMNRGLFLWAVQNSLQNNGTVWPSPPE